MQDIRKRLFPVVAALALLSTVLFSGGILPAAADDTVPAVPYGDFQGMEELDPLFLDNNGQKLPRWTKWTSGTEDVFSVSDEAPAPGGKSGAIANPAGVVSDFSVDMFGDTALAPGQYTLSAMMKTDAAGAVTLNTAAWIGDAIDWDNTKLTTEVTGPFDWKPVTLDFAVDENTEAVRIQVQMVGNAGTLYLTDVKVEKKVLPTEPVVPYGDFQGMEGLDPLFLSNDGGRMARWTAWSNLDTAVFAVTDQYPSAETAGKSVAITNPDGGVSHVFVDLFDNYRLAPGDYTLEAYGKIDDAAKATLEVAQWGESAPDFDNKVFAEFTGPMAWKRVTLNFTVDEGVDCVRIIAQMAAGAGTARFTNFQIIPKTEEPQKDPIPYHDFTGMEELDPVFLLNSDRPKERWCAWGNVVNEGRVELSDVSNTQGGKSALITNQDGEVNQIFVDLFGTNALKPGGRYIVNAYMKMEGSGGAALAATAWKGDGIDWTSTTQTDVAGPADWAKVSHRFTVPEDAETMRIMVQMAAGAGKTYVTDFTIEEDTSSTSVAEVANPRFEEDKALVQYQTPAGEAGNAIRYNWGVWLGKAADGTPMTQTWTDAFQIVKTGTPDGIGGAVKITAQAEGAYNLRQIVENLDPAMEFVLRCQIKTEELTGEGAYLRAAFLDAEKNVIWEVDSKMIQSAMQTGTKDWTETYIKFSLPEGACDLLVSAEVSEAQGAAYFTDFELMPAVFYDTGDGGDGDDDDNQGGGTEPGGDKEPGNTGGDNTEDPDDKPNGGDGDEDDVPGVKTGVEPVSAGLLLLTALSSGAALLAKKRRKA